MDILSQQKYKFLYEDEFFKTHPICYLTLAGSRAYGTNTPNSDIDIRGFYLDNVDELLTLTNIKEEYINKETDTVIYSFKKFMKLLASCNPNIIELLGTKEEHILLSTNISKLIRNNSSLFLSKRAYITFIGYATSQLRRLENALSINNKSDKQLLQSINNSLLSTLDFKNIDSNGKFSIYITDDEIECNISANSSLKKLINFFKSLDVTVKNFDSLNHRNRKKDTDHLNKHAMHLIRLYLMGIDILLKHKINTYRSEKYLMDIRFGKMTMAEVFKLQQELNNKIVDAYEKSSLPDTADINKINQLILQVYKGDVR